MMAALRAIWLGIVIGSVNTAVTGCEVASQLESWENDPDARSAGLLAGLLTGAFVGLVGHLLGRASRGVRRVVMAGIAIAVVCGLAEHFMLERFANEACIPTVVAALILEHYTHRREAPSAVPAARVR